LPPARRSRPAPALASASSIWRRSSANLRPTTSTPKSPEREPDQPMTSPFQQILGADFTRLPAPVQHLHSLTHDIDTAGRAEITAPSNPAAWLLSRLGGLPARGQNVPVTVAFHVAGAGREFWRRRFSGRRYASGFAAGEGAHARQLVERFFPFVFYHRLT